MEMIGAMLFLELWTRSSLRAAESRLVLVQFLRSVDMPFFSAFRVG